MTCGYSSLFCPTKINILCWFSFVFYFSVICLTGYISVYKLATLRSFCGSRSHLFSKCDKVYITCHRTVGNTGKPTKKLSFVCQNRELYALVYIILKRFFFRKIFAGGTCFRGQFLVPVGDGVRWGERDSCQDGVSGGGTWKIVRWGQKCPPGYSKIRANFGVLNKVQLSDAVLS